MWTPPHFWALALFTRDDYARAGIPMMPNVAGDESTRRQILVYAVLLAPIGALPWLLGHAGPLYGVAALLLGAEFVRRALAALAARRCRRQSRRQEPLRLSRSSISSRSSRVRLVEARVGRTGSVADQDEARRHPHTGAGEATAPAVGGARASCSPSLVVLFYVMALVRGPGVLHDRPT